MVTYKMFLSEPTFALLNRETNVLDMDAILWRDNKERDTECVYVCSVV